MENYNYAKKAISLSLFIDQCNTELRSKIVAVQEKTDKVVISTTESLTPELKSELDAVFSAHDASKFSTPRIVRLAREEASSKFFHNINYKSELKIKLQMTVEFGKPGLLTKAVLFEDHAKTIPVLEVHREYKEEAITGKLLEKKTIRKHYNEDGTINPNFDDQKGWYAYTGTQSRHATNRKRQNITNELEDEMIGLLVALAVNDQGKADNIASGAAFITAMAPAINAYHLSGTVETIVEFINLPQTQASFPFLLADIPGAGIKAKDLIVLRLST